MERSIFILVLVDLLLDLLLELGVLDEDIVGKGITVIGNKKVM
jgi:hypothetical protein